MTSQYGLYITDSIIINHHLFFFGLGIIAFFLFFSLDSSGPCQTATHGFLVDTF